MLRLFLVIFTLFTVSNVVFAYPEDTPSRDLGMRDEGNDSRGSENHRNINQRKRKVMRQSHRRSKMMDNNKDSGHDNSAQLPKRMNNNINRKMREPSTSNRDSSSSPRRMVGRNT